MPSPHQNAWDTKLKYIGVYLGVGDIESSSKASQLNTETPQAGPQGYGGPQPGYTPQGGYGLPPAGYGAPPPGYGGYGPPLPPGVRLINNTL